VFFLSQQTAVGAFDVDDGQDGPTILEDLVQSGGKDAREVGTGVDGFGPGDGVLNDRVNPAKRDGLVEEAVEHLLGTAQGGVCDEDGNEDELAEPGFGDSQMEQDVAIGRRGWGEGVFEGIEGFVLLAVDELAADVVIFGEAGDTGTLMEGVQSEVDALLVRQALRGTGGRSTRRGYNAHGLASGGSRFVQHPRSTYARPFRPLPRLQFVTQL
jgi:hypothetical protein